MLRSLPRPVKRFVVGSAIGLGLTLVLVVIGQILLRRIAVDVDHLLAHDLVLRCRDDSDRPADYYLITECGATEWETMEEGRRRMSRLFCHAHASELMAEEARQGRPVYNIVPPRTGYSLEAVARGYLYLTTHPPKGSKQPDVYLLRGELTDVEQSVMEALRMHAFVGPCPDPHSFRLFLTPRAYQTWQAWRYMHQQTREWGLRKLILYCKRMIHLYGLRCARPVLLIDGVEVELEP